MTELQVKRTYKIGRVYTFQAAHRLPKVPPVHKCYSLHGHTYTVRVELTGRVDATLGWVQDFGFIDTAWSELCHRQLDHAYLNEIEGLQNPTSEILCGWIYDRLSLHLSGIKGFALSAVEVSENGRSMARLEIG